MAQDFIQLECIIPRKDITHNLEERSVLRYVVEICAELHVNLIWSKAYYLGSYFGDGALNR